MTTASSRSSKREPGWRLFAEDKNAAVFVKTER